MSSYLMPDQPIGKVLCAVDTKKKFDQFELHDSRELIVVSTQVMLSHRYPENLSDLRCLLTSEAKTLLSNYLVVPGTMYIELCISADDWVLISVKYDQILGSVWMTETTLPEVYKFFGIKE